LKNIGLDSDDEVGVKNEEEKVEDKWSNAYFSINCLENIFAKCN